MAPSTAPVSITPRSWRSAASRSTSPRRTGASSTWLTSAASSASGPPRAPERKPSMTASAMANPMTAGPSWRTSASDPASSGCSPKRREEKNAAAPETMAVT